MNRTKALKIKEIKYLDISMSINKYKLNIKIEK